MDKRQICSSEECDSEVEHPQKTSKCFFPNIKFDQVVGSWLLGESSLAQLQGGWEDASDIQLHLPLEQQVVEMVGFLTDSEIHHLPKTKYYSKIKLNPRMTLTNKFSI